MNFVSHSIAAAVQRMSVRERWLAVALLLVALTGVAVTAFDWSNRQQDREVNAAAALEARRQARVRASAARLDPAERGRLAALEATALQAPDVWIARVRIEEQLAAAAAAAGVAQPELAVAAGAEGEGALDLVRAELSGPYVRPTFAALLRQITAAPTAVIVEEVQVDRTQEPRFKLTLLYPVRLARREGRS